MGGFLPEAGKVVFMLKKMSTFFLRTLREDPADAEVDSHKLLVRGGYIRRAAPGGYTWLPMGLQVLRKVEAVVRQEMEAIGAQEVVFPSLLPREPYEATNRWEEFGPSLFKLKDRKDADYLLAPTHEEMFTLLVKDLYSSYKDLPLALYQIKDKYRDEARPRAGLIRGREFIMKDSYSFDIDEDGLNRSYDAHRGAYEKIFTRLGLDYAICSAMAGAMGGSRSEEFLFPCEIGEDTFVRSPGGYAANVEAVTTVAPAPLDASNVPAAQVRSTPGASSIEDLVEFSNQNFPREDRPWTKADMLKALLVTAVHPNGQREVIVVCVPGDRDVDMKRLEAALAPAEVELASEDDLKPYPDIVAGFTGPTCAGPNHPARQVDEDGNISGSPRVLVDPRVVEGSVWVSGAGETDKHFYNLVMGRDFTVDGTVEACEIKPGDPAPDGSGPLELARGIEIGHIFALGKKYAQALGLNVLDQNGKSQVVTMGSYGIGVSRLVAAIAEEYHDDKGLSWPVQVAPFHVQVMPTIKGEDVYQAAQKISEELSAAGLEVLLDDRQKVSAGVKFADFELLGVPYAVVVGRSLAEGQVELRNRATGERVSVPVGEGAATMVQWVKDALKESGN